MSDGGFAGSKVRREKLTGCLLIVTAGDCLEGGLHERAQQPSQTMARASSDTEAVMKRCEGNTVSAFILRVSVRLKLTICGRG
jgi:hypothetical protein